MELQVATVLAGRHPVSFKNCHKGKGHCKVREISEYQAN